MRGTLEGCTLRMDPVHRPKDTVMSVDWTRCFPVPDSVPKATSQNLLTACEKILKKSRDRSSAAGSLYSGGLGPQVYVPLRLAEHHARAGNKEVAARLLRQALEAAKYTCNLKDNKRATLLEGSHIGAMCLLAILSKRESTLKKAHNESTAGVDDWKDLSETLIHHVSEKCQRLPPGECEVLYGRAGALAAIFFLRSELGIPMLGTSLVQSIALDILRQGLKEAEEIEGANLELPLVWQLTICSVGLPRVNSY